ncbi:MAG: hypothetical protein U1E86_28705 [Burkholderiaceae bacterium]
MHDVVSSARRAERRLEQVVAAARERLVAGDLSDAHRLRDVPSSP